jgi:CBS domain-containing protein
MKPATPGPSGAGRWRASKEAAMRVTDVMSSDVRTIDGSESIERARAMMNHAGVHHLVVLHCGRMIGLVSAGRLEVGEAEGILRVEDVMWRHVRCATPETTLPAAATLLREQPSGALPVMKGAQVVGIVTASDLLEVLARGGGPAALPKRATARKLAQHPPRPVARRAHR